MGKGNRSRDGRDTSILTNPQKPKKQKKGRAPLPKWLVPTLISVVAVIVVFAIVFAALVNNGVFKRNNVLVKSQEQSKFSINQMAAQIMLWYSGWVQGQNVYYQTITTSSEYDENKEFSWCWAYASSTQSDLKETISNSAEWLEELTALCDWGQKNGVAFTAEDEDTAYDAFVSAFRSQAKSYYKYGKEVGFPNADGETEQFPVDYSSYVDYPSYPYFSGFLRNIFGKGISSADFRRAAIVLTYASRVKTLKSGEYWGSDATEVAKELKENPDKYYTVDYLTYTTDDQELYYSLIGVNGGEDGVNEFKKAIVTDYIENNYFGEYNKQLANELLEKLQGKTGEDLATALEAQNLTAETFEAPVAPAAPAEGEGDGEPAGDGEGDATEGEGDVEPAGEGAPADNGLTKKQSEWLFNKDRKNGDMEVVTEEDGSSTLLVVTEVTKDDDGNVTAVKAVVKNFAETLAEAELYTLVNEVCHHLGLPHDHAAHDDEDEAEGDAEPAEGEGDATEGGTEEAAATPSAWDNLVEAMEKGANNKLPSKSSTAYVKKTDADKDVEDVKTELEGKASAEDKVAYLKEKNASENTGVTADSTVIDEAIKAVIFPEEGTVEEGTILVVETGEGNTIHLIYVSEVKTETIEPAEGEATEGEATEGEEAEGEEAGSETKTLVTFYDYSVSKYSTGLQKFLFEEVNEEDMTGGAAVGRTYPHGESNGKYTVSIVTRALGLGDDVVRGGYISYTSKESADADLKKLEGLTGAELLSKLSELSSSATTSNAITQSSISSADLKEWLFDDARQANDATVVYHEDEDGNIMEGIYLAVFLDRTSAGESNARTNVANDKADDFARGLAEDGGYKLNEKALAKIGKWLYK